MNLAFTYCSQEVNNRELKIRRRFMDTHLKVLHLLDMSHEENIKVFIEAKIAECNGAEAFAEKIGFTERAVHTWRAGDRHPNRRAMNAMAEAFGVTVKDIITFGEERPPDLGLPDYVAIPYLRQEAQGGPGGRTAQPREVRSYLAFSRQWIESKGKANTMEVLRVRGDSMSPTVNDGDVVLVDKSQTGLVDGKLYLVSHNNELKIKRLWVDEEPEERIDYWLISDNKRYAKESVQKIDDFVIIGRALWRASELP
jgi:SOS-response transcriptional repressor LexA